MVAARIVPASACSANQAAGSRSTRTAAPPGASGAAGWHAPSRRPAPFAGAFAGAGAHGSLVQTFVLQATSTRQISPRSPKPSVKARLLPYTSSAPTQRCVEPRARAAAIIAIASSGLGDGRTGPPALPPWRSARGRLPTRRAGTTGNPPRPRAWLSIISRDRFKNSPTTRLFFMPRKKNIKYSV